ncbi:MAG: PilZ domain-containing protein [Desulfobacterales bacterium]|nr:MAG: PilZ domain-containing protein [Desulfobacterales bacterium]
MSEAETEELLQELNHRRTSNKKQKERRKHPRKRTFIYIDCLGNKCEFTDFIQNISESGLYIETQMPLLTDQELLMSFFHPASNNPIDSTGTIVRIDSNGIGVQFDELIPGV